ncbi:MAG: helix-turn-helix transcriptional regulator [Euryarchaeota archaeon]|nr:helix-turn-helix transcriptional regulator [Euryarchaeota archaeon]
MSDGPPPPRHGPTAEQLDRFRAHLAATRAFSARLVEERCVPSERFLTGVQGTVSVLDPLFSAWNPALLFHLHVHGPRRFNELKTALEAITSRVLTDKLRHLEEEGFVTRVQEGEVQRYALTEDGTRLAQLVHPAVFFLHNRERLASTSPGDGSG